MRYRKVYDGEWNIVLHKDKTMCCDCGLVHDYETKMVNGDLYMKFTRNRRSTGQARRWLKKKIGFHGLRMLLDEYITPALIKAVKK